MAFRLLHARIACLGIDQKQPVDPLNQFSCAAVVRIQFERLKHLPAGMRPTGGTDHLRSTRMVIGDIAVGLQNTLERAEKLFRAFAPASHPEVEDDASSGLSILP